MEKTIHQYIKRKIRGSLQNVGVLVGHIDDNGVVSLGWSKVALTRGDKFDKKRGMEMAKGRLKSKRIIIPQSIYDDMLHFMDRCRRYYKDMSAFVTVYSYNDLELT